MNLQTVKGAMKIVAGPTRAEVTIDQGHQLQGHQLPIRATKVAAIQTVMKGTTTRGVDQDITIKDAGITMTINFLSSLQRLPSGTDTDITPKFLGGRQFSRMPIPDAGAQPRAVGCPRHGLCLQGSACILCKFVLGPCPAHSQVPRLGPSK